ncbi:MAG TPA: S8 family serine peptidase [Steroidobacteraceae bacterium]|nr:S8 family serine peptidase [Steroidobacteraceae bacterium]
MERFKRLGIAALTVSALTATAVAGIAPRTRPAQPAAAPAVAHLVAFGGRGHGTDPAPGKLDSMLADIVRHAGGVRAGSKLADLRALNPAARFQVTATAGPMVLIDAVTRGDPQRLKAALVSLGLRNASLYSNDVSGWMPVSRLTAAAARTEVHAMRAALPRARTGSVTSTGDYVQGSEALRGLWQNFDGRGITVGVLSDSFDCYAVYAQPNSGVPQSGPNGWASNTFTADAAKDVSTGDLPSGVTVLAEADQAINDTCMDFSTGFSPSPFLPYSDEGRAMLQVVHDVAPGAGLAFHTAVEGEADFANGILALASSGAKVIADDIGYFDEPFFQPSMVGEVINQVNAQGVAYFVAAGNDAQLSYDNAAPSFATASTSPNPPGEMLLTFGTSAGAPVTFLPVTIAPVIGGVVGTGGLVPGEFVAIVAEWDQPYLTGAPSSGGATSQLDLCISVASAGGDTITEDGLHPVTCTGPNTIGGDPVLILLVGNPASAAGNTSPETITISLGLVNGSAAPGRIKIAVLDNGAGSTINEFFTPGSTVQGHAAASGAMSMGAAWWVQTPACGVTPAVPESFSSAGGDPMLFDADGNRLATPFVPQKPDLIAPDGGNDTFLGFKVSGTVVTGFPQCVNNPNLPSFFGTSAATPHAAGVAALMLQSNPAVTATQVYDALRKSADPMTSSPAAQVGAGFIQAQAALALLPPGPPTLTLASSTISAGASTTLTWSSINTTGCTASNSWTGAQHSSGSMTVMQASAGTYTYTLVCVNAAGTSASASATLMVQAAGGSGGGGGGLDALTLLALAALALQRGLAVRASARRAH